MSKQTIITLFESIEAVRFGDEERNLILTLGDKLDYQLTPQDVKGKPDLEKYLLNTLLFAAQKRYFSLLGNPDKAQVMKDFVKALLEAGADADKVVNDYADQYLILSPYAYAILNNQEEMIVLMDKYHIVHNLSNLHTKKRPQNVNNINFANRERKERKSRASRKKKLGNPVNFV